MNNNPNVQINTVRSLFQGREEVFAVRWEKAGKSGYMPAYQYDPYHYRVHKMNGGIPVYQKIKIMPWWSTGACTRIFTGMPLHCM